LRCAQRYGIECLEAHEQAAQPAGHGLLEQPGAQHRLNGARGLPEPPNAAHAVEQSLRETRVAEEVVVEKVEVPARQP
jgi:hypothetical protein